jgi:sugar transferase (PEP-CTERM/EpsH1 system associated)
VADRSDLLRVLFLTHRLPYAPNRGDRVRAYHLVREIARWATIDLVSLVHDDEEASHADDLKPLVKSINIARVPKLWNMVRAAVALPGATPTTHALLDAPGFGAAVDQLAAGEKPDVVLSFCTGIGPAAFRSSLAGVPVVLDMVDVDSRKWAALAATAAFPKSYIYTREARTLRAFEATMVRRCAATLVVNDRERDELATIAPGAAVAVIENGVDIDSLRPPGAPAGKPLVTFCGVMNYAPNVEGVVWLAREIWPLIQRARPDAELRIVGASPAPAVQGLADPARKIVVTGAVPDVRPYLWESAVSVAPLKTSRGLQNKVLEALAAGLPAVVTTAVMAGLPPSIQPACEVSDTAEGFADAVVRWLNEPAAAARTAALGSGVGELSWERQLSGLRGIIEGAAGSRARANRG